MYSAASSDRQQGGEPGRHRSRIRAACPFSFSMHWTDVLIPNIRYMSQQTKAEACALPNRSARKQWIRWRGALGRLSSGNRLGGLVQQVILQVSRRREAVVNGCSAKCMCFSQRQREVAASHALPQGQQRGTRAAISLDAASLRLSQMKRTAYRGQHSPHTHPSTLLPQRQTRGDNARPGTRPALCRRDHSKQDKRPESSKGTADGYGWKHRHGLRRSRELRAMHHV